MAVVTWNADEQTAYEFIKEHGKTMYNVTYKGYVRTEEGYTRGVVTEDIKLFTGSGQIGYLPKGKRSNGYVFDNEILGLSIKTKEVKEEDKEVKFQKDTKKILNHLAKFNLWTDVQFSTRLMKLVGYELSHKAYEFSWCHWYKQSDETADDFNNRLRAEMIERERVANKILSIVKGSDIENDFNIEIENSKMSDEFKIGETYDYYNDVDKALFGTSTYSKLFHLFRDFDMINNAKIKKMCFHKGTWNARQTEWILADINNAMTNKKDFRASGFNGYDVKFQYDAEKKRAWYSEEFVGCGNGHYYLALNDTHAIHCEDD